ncbi:uncharacterized protein PAC_07201 [Phialocephala subalpina]|uniref:WSC domain-containing protein n=1 Tax=Phialocephala subalpina TaxID=576137 RepID=A0A1L7WX05_9HELO|nr:uncharacterized protein PAC_07201 [Phialocephala subalpina]
MYTTPRLSFASLAMFATTVVPSSATLMSSRATTINEFTYNSCQSASDFQDASLGFVSVANSSFMSVGLCTSKCASDSNYAFAALYNTECFCGQHFTAIASGQDTECDTPCPGYPADTCGGSKGNEWYSLYSKSGSLSSTNTTVSATATPGMTITSSMAVTGTSIPPAGNLSTSVMTTSSSSATSTPSQVSVSGAVAAIVGVERVGLLVAMVGLLAFL